MTKIEYNEKKIDKLLKKQAYCKVYIANDEVNFTHFNGIILNQNKVFLLMCDLNDFNFDGFVVFKKSDISEIKYGNNEKFINNVLIKEKIKDLIFDRYLSYNFELKDYKTMFEKLKEIKMPIIVEQLYFKYDLFQLGIINKIKNKKVLIDYLNASGEFDLKPVIAEYKNITCFRFDSPYANLYFKYSINK